MGWRVPGGALTFREASAMPAQRLEGSDALRPGGDVSFASPLAPPPSSLAAGTAHLGCFASAAEPSLLSSAAAREPACCDALHSATAPFTALTCPRRRSYVPIVTILRSICARVQGS
eukprot:736660-Prorocentrum_minimum.AAC.2